MKKNYLSSLLPVHDKNEELFLDPEADQESELERNAASKKAKTPYLPEPSKGAPHNGPEKTVIAEGVSVIGSITSSGDVDIFGSVKGNITTAGSILLAGSVEGDIAAKEINFAKAVLKGNATASEVVILEDGSNVQGDITSSDFILDSELVGNVNVSGTIQLKKMAVLTGNIEAASIEIAKGAVFNGTVVLKK